MSDAASAILPHRLNAEGHDFVFPVGDGRDLVLHSSGAVDWWLDGQRVRQAALPHDVANTILTSLGILDDFYSFVCRQLEHAQRKEPLNQMELPEPLLGAHKPAWQADEKQPRTEVVRQGPRFTANGVDVHLLDDGATWVRREGNAREALNIPSDAQKTILSKTGNLIYAFSQAWREYEQLIRTNLGGSTS